MSSRRTFLMGASGAAASHLAAQQALSANDRVRIAVLGVNGRGKDHIKGIMSQPNAEVVMLCDPDLKVAESRAASFEKTYGKKPAIE
ncbi:MAG: gfo/Idh/MocA family oxidoreductase, partial [Bryobacterales bacterium]|nr:gfo/Idh/MocA family oxidoreductase [Bryobacterales bacterium]